MSETSERECVRCGVVRAERDAALRANREAEAEFIKENAVVRDLRATIQRAIDQCETAAGLAAYHTALLTWARGRRDFAQELLPRLRKSLEGEQS